MLRIGSRTAGWFIVSFTVVGVLVARLAIAASPPFERTEDRSPCAHYDPLRQPLFGETHLHTAYSFDAAILDTRNTPADAYRYAKGGVVGLPPWTDTREQFAPEPPPPTSPPEVAQYPYCLPPARCEFTASRAAQLPEGRALDWAAITDHAEQLGEANICLFEPTFPCTSDAQCPSGQECGTVLQQRTGATSTLCTPKGYSSPLCTLAREELTRLTSGIAAVTIAAIENGAENPSRVDYCDATRAGDGARCLQQAGQVWQQIQNDAEAAYDRTSACTFTSFIAYEYTAMMSAGRCEDAPTLPCWDQLNTGQPSADCTAAPPGASQACTSDYPGNSGYDNMHRNVIFRNDDVLALPISNVEAPVGCGNGADCTRPYPIGSPQQLLDDLRARCKARPAEHPRCDVLSIPHNSNLSGGAMFLTPESLDEARVRSEMEPLVEMMQIKGSSECRFMASMPGAWNATDEECSFENESFDRLGGEWLAPEDRTPENLPPASYVRNTLENGIAYDAQHGVNPFQLGFVGGLDNHNGTPGHSEEVDYARHGAHGDQSFAVSAQILNEKYYLGLETNGGGLTVAWAEENSRDSIFAALARRETYATSGTRPTVRFFGGPDVPADMCGRGDFAARGYASGVPMGGTLAHSSAAPRFAVSAAMDPGWPNHPGTKLDRVQIIKGWVDAGGATHEQVFDVPATGDGTKPIVRDTRALPGGDAAAVDLRTCRPTGVGRATLCGVWQDPQFDPAQHAFYYARVLEQPSCRWNQLYCNARGVDCSRPAGTCGSTDPAFNGRGCSGDAECGGGVCETPLSYTRWEYQQCCSGLVPSTVQQRAWTSPIWYRPSNAEGAS
ncbi:DUF3604 domain-containing protein [Candidatus Binatia bacterium]|nr:DUF3604 domain-containing protein [Candidatus Binatia bacterium]